MLQADNVAKYFLSKDKSGKIFNFNIVNYNGRKSYEGNIRLNKYLFLSQVVYLAKNDECLLSDDFVAYDNGPVITYIISNYGKIVADKNDNIRISENVKNFLDKIYDSLKDASYEELIEITHEDPEWKNLCHNTYNAPKMNIERYKNFYKIKYKGLIEALKI